MSPAEIERTTSPPHARNFALMFVKFPFRIRCWHDFAQPAAFMSFVQSGEKCEGTLYVCVRFVGAAITSSSGRKETTLASDLCAVSSGCMYSIHK